MKDSNNKSDRKQEILEGAFVALKKNGLSALSFNAVAEEAGVSRQLIRYHFRDSEALMLDLCDYLAGLYRDALIASVSDASGDARIDVFLDFYFDLLDGTPKPRDDQVYDAMMSLAAGSRKIRENLRSQYGLLGHVLSHEFELKYPDIGSQAASELSYLFVCLMYGHWKMVASLGLSEEHKHVTRRAMDRLIQSYVSKSGDTASFVSVWS